MNEKRVALVTGVGCGIGAAIARRLAAKDYAVVVNFADNAQVADEIVFDIRWAGGEALVVQADLSDAAAVRRLFDEAVRQYGRVDVLVNNAGTISEEAPAVADTAAVFDHVFAVNLKGTFNTLCEAAQRLRDGGRIVNFSRSVIGHALPGYAAAVAGNGAVEALIGIMAMELCDRNITVNAVVSGQISTDLFLKGKRPKVAGFPAQTHSHPFEDIANAVAFLVGQDGTWINGQTLCADGVIAER